MASARRTSGEKEAESTHPTRHQFAMASGRRSISPWRTNHSRGEQRRPKILRADVAKPTGEVTVTRHGEYASRHGECIRTEHYK
ncbi:hypothetical protein QL285_075018 [Trifolium repens]|nr:hypothetical protein QL285_075018 [Trifolium repens]